MAGQILMASASSGISAAIMVPVKALPFSNFGSESCWAKVLP